MEVASPNGFAEPGLSDVKYADGKARINPGDYVHQAGYVCHNKFSAKAMASKLLAR